MSEHKFTDDEIVKGMNAYVTRMCNKCNVKDLGTCCGSCFITIISQGADLINRQKAEIEDLEIKNEHLVCFLAEARKDVSKEFAKKLHKDIDNFREKREMVMLPYTEAALLYIEKCIDNFVKEMTEGER